MEIYENWLYEIKLKNLSKELEKNGMNIFVVNNKKEALEKAIELIPKDAICAFGGSVSVDQIGLKDYIISNYKVFNQYDEKLTPEEKYNMRIKGLTADWYISGTNAITEKGELVNLDGIGNRVAAFSFGPKKILLIIGRNKIVKDINEAVERIKRLAAPMNAKRLNLNTPCAISGICIDCNSPQRICNILNIIYKSKPEGKINIILVNENLGL